jgi:hypothetical protein
MKVSLQRSTLLTLAIVLSSATYLVAQSTPPAPAQQGLGSGQGRGMRGMGGMAGGRGVLGTVTEATADHYTIKTDAGESYTVHFSVNTRILKQPAGRPGGGREGGGRRQQQADADSPDAGNGNGAGSGGDRAQPQPLKPTDIKIGDMITAGGELDATTKSIGAIFILQLDPERAKQARAMQANFGKTWLAGRITGIDGTKITIEGISDHAPHAIVVDENTSFHKRRDSITLADIKPGDQLRAEGAVKDGAFLATTVNAMNPADFQNREPSPVTGAAPSNPQPH